MISKYKKISIIYGGSGAECAEAIHKKLIQDHISFYYPIQSLIMKKEILSSANIMETVQNIISNSSACVIILTFDDVDNTRVRQNVLIELGMALSYVKKENCFFLCDKHKLPDDFPSDLKGFVNPNYFDKSKIDITVECLNKEIISHLNLECTENICFDLSYQFNRNILSDIPSAILEKRMETQMHGILDEWLKNIKSFDFVSERIMYILERIEYLPVFNNDSNTDHFLNEIYDLIIPTKNDVENGTYIKYTNLCNFIKNIINYIQLKTKKDVINSLYNIETNKKQDEFCRKKFKRISIDINEFIETFKNGDDYNWLIQIAAYDYAALADLMQLKYVNTGSKEYITILDRIINNFEVAINIAKKYDINSDEMWLGYLTYNITRAYVLKFKITENCELIESIYDYLEHSIEIRYTWVIRNPFHGIFANAISYEYFLASKYDYELRAMIPEYTNETMEDQINNLIELKNELNLYCENSEFGKLSDIRMRIEELIHQIKLEVQAY